MRVENWSSKLELVIENTIKQEKFIRGKNDCFTFVINSIEAIINKKVFDKQYRTLKILCRFKRTVSGLGWEGYSGVRRRYGISCRTVH